MKKQGAVRGQTLSFSQPGGEPMVPPAPPGAGGYIDMKKFILDPAIASEFNENGYKSGVLPVSICFIAVSQYILQQHGHSSWKQHGRAA